MHKPVAELDAAAAMRLAPNQHQAKLLAMPEQARLVLLRKVVQSSGAKCSKVTRTFHQGADTRENHIWSVACAQGGSFSITLYNDAKGSTGVVDCGVLLAVTGLACFEPFSK